MFNLGMTTTPHTPTTTPDFTKPPKVSLIERWREHAEAARQRTAEIADRDAR